MHPLPTWHMEHMQGEGYVQLVIFTCKPLIPKVHILIKVLSLLQENSFIVNRSHGRTGHLFHPRGSWYDYSKFSWHEYRTHQVFDQSKIATHVHSQQASLFISLTAQKQLCWTRQEPGNVLVRMHATPPSPCLCYRLTRQTRWKQPSDQLPQRRLCSKQGWLRLCMQAGTICSQ